MEKIRNSARQGWIDNLKGIAIIAITMMHSGVGNLPNMLGRIGGIGASGVQLFFIISAYLVFKSYNRYVQNKQISFKDNLHWLFLKIIRLAPAYYLALIVSGLVQGGAPYWLGNDGKITIKNILFHLVFLHGFVPHYANSIIGVEWYIGTLVIFYAAVPLIYNVIHSVEQVIIGIVPIAISSYLLCSIMTRISLNSTDIDVYAGYFSTFWIVAQAVPIGLGIMLYYSLAIIDKNANRIIHKKLLAYSILAVVSIFLLEMAYNKSTLYFMNRC